MKKRLLFLCVFLMVLTTSAFASEAVYTDAQGNAYVTDGENFYAGDDFQLFSEDAAGEETSQLTPLGDPSNLRWDTEKPGVCHWDIVDKLQKQVEFKVYKINGQGDDVLAYETTHHYDNPPQMETFSYELFWYHANIIVDNWTSTGRIGSGDYYFTVKLIGDGTQYSDSNEISSKDAENGIFHYEEPEEKLEVPEAGHWEWPAAIWVDKQSGHLSGSQQTGVEKDERIETYVIEYAYSEEPVDDPSGAMNIGGSYQSASGMPDSWLQEKLIGENGAGYYYFRIRALSKDIMRWQNGEFSGWSEGYNLGEAIKKVTESLKDIEETASAEEIRSKVQELNTTELANAITADIRGNTNGSVDALTALEKRVGGQAKPKVDDELAGSFAVDKVSIVGANLNDVLNSSDETTLNIGKPNQKHTRPENYNNSVAVGFSMDLGNVQNTHDLQVPVKVTLPVPEGINPNFLVILHYRLGDYYEEVIYNVFKDEEGQYFVSFVLTSFSDFLFTETLISIKVDSNGAYNVPDMPDGAKLLLAKYDTNGRMVSITEQKNLSGILNANEKLFLLSPNSVPLCECGKI